MEMKRPNLKANPASKNIPKFIFPATEAEIDEFTERKVLEQCLNLALIVRKINQGGLECLSQHSLHLRKDET